MNRLVFRGGWTVVAWQGDEIAPKRKIQLNTGADVDERHAFLLIGWEHVEGWPLMWRERHTAPPLGRKRRRGVWWCSGGVAAE